MGENAAQLYQRTQQFWRCWYHGMATKNSSRPEPRRQAVVLQRNEPRSFGGAQKIVSGPPILDIELFIVGVWFCFDLMVAVPWLFFLELKKNQTNKHITSFLSYRNP